ncbi:MAG: hypothetical protein ACOYM2_22160 [Rectinemataceae bacterium]
MNHPSALLELDLRSDIDYPGKLTIPSNPAGFFPPGPSAGEKEEVYLFSPEIYEPTQDGPRGRLRQPLPEAAFASAAAQDDGAGTPCFCIEAGSWIFAQWRPESAEDLAEGMEWCAREAWWEQRRLEGPWLLRLVREDGQTAYQLLRRLTK